MSKKKDYIPDKFEEFHSWQDTLIAYVVLNVAGWNVAGSAAELTAIQAQQTIYEPLYQIAKKKGQRTADDVTNHNTAKKLLKKLIRTFVGKYLVKNNLVTANQRTAMKIPIYDTVKSKRPKITVVPIVSADSAAGATVKLIVRLVADTSRPSIHPDADVIEVSGITITQPPPTVPPAPPAPVIPPPNSRADCNKVFTSKKAQFIIQLDPNDVGKKFYGFVRYRNDSDDSKSGSAKCDVYDYDYSVREKF